jgi:23S rRNA pseudouridine955/2504/2580 synthase
MKSVTLVKVASQPFASAEGGAERHATKKPSAMPFTLLEVTIKTGRTHQIRVHLASEGHPIAGDDKYGDFEWNKELQKQGLKRMFLHAWQLRFSHPADQHAVSLLAELPAELRPWAGLAKPSTPE